MAMKIAAHIDSVDAIPEDATIKVRDLYEEVDGGGYAVVLQPKNGWNNENVSGLKDSLRKRRDGTERLDELETFLDSLGYLYWDETTNPAVAKFLQADPE